MPQQFRGTASLCPGHPIDYRHPIGLVGRDHRSRLYVEVNMIVLTDQQRRAITTRDTSVALSAGAGCGKTFVLTERFLAQLAPDSSGRTRLGQVVAITFTERAAREMRDRIRTACTERLLECPDDQVDHWLELVREIDSARISTIHSFCGSVLRAHAVDAGLDPQFRVLDQAQADTLLSELLDRQLRRRLAEHDDAVIDLIVQFGLSGLHERIAMLLGRRQEIDWDQWLAEKPEELAARWEEYFRTDVLPRIMRQITDSEAAQTLLGICRDRPSNNSVMLDRFRLLLERLPKLAESAVRVAGGKAEGDAPAVPGHRFALPRPPCKLPKDDLKEIREAAKVQGGGGKKAWTSDEIYQQFSESAKALRKLIDKQKKMVGFDAEQAGPSAEAALQLLAVTAEIAKAYEDQKRELGVLDFNDLLIRTRDLLVGPNRAAMRKQLDSQIRLLLVDEFQDTDPLQVELVRALCDDDITRNKLFFVGDYKQSIYRFRGAQPQVFRQLREQVPEGGRLPLTLNFRSQPAILDFVNALFCEEFGPSYEPLRPHRPQVSPHPAVEFLWAASDETESDNFGKIERLRRLEADRIAQRIRDMLDSGEELVWDEESARAGRPAARAVRPGDIALLFRALSNVEIYEEALRRYDIDYYLVGGHAFYSQQEVFDLLNLLRAIDNPCDQISLAGVLRSPFFNLLDETLFHLAGHPDGLFAGELGAPITDQQRSRVEFAAGVLRELRAMKDRVPIAQLINEALERTGYDAILPAEFLGTRKLANLQKLIEQARSFDRSGIFTLSDFITQLSEFVAQQPKEALAATHGESTDVVRLMTIHQSKGLEFPVVVVPDLDRRRHGSTTTVAFTPQLGPMVKVPEFQSGLDLYRLAESDEEDAELVRLLYVAVTRAADYLVLSSGVEKLGKATGPWMKLLGRRFDLLDGTSKDVTTKAPRLRRGAQTAAKPQAAVRRDLEKVIEQAGKMAAQGQCRVPKYIDPVPRDHAARRQYSFSRLTGEFHAVDAAPPAEPLEDGIPIQSQKIDPLTMGKLVHAVLEEIDFSNPAEIAETVRRCAGKQLIDVNGDILDEPIDMVGRFLASPRAARIAAAEQMHPELEFLLAWPPDGNEHDGRYIQGFIDCIYQDSDDRWHLVDYKTNRVDEGNVASVAKGYQMQMLLYALATERILGQGPVELVLHFLRGGLEYNFPWDDDSRRRVIETVDRAINTAACGLAGESIQ